MAHQGHLDILKQGVEAWNRWREEHIDIIPDLSNADLRDTYLRGIHLNKADLRGTILLNSKLRGADFSKADLRYALLGFAELDGANFLCAVLNWVSFYGSTLHAANFKETNLSGADFRGARFEAIDKFYGRDDDYSVKLEGTDLSGADLRGVNLSGADLSQANLAGADLREATLSGANLHVAIPDIPDQRRDDFEAARDRFRLFIALTKGNESTAANLKGTDLRGADLKRTDLRGVNLGEARIGCPDLSGADLREADLKGIDLSGGIFQGADLRGIDFGGSDLSGADLKEADLRGTDLSKIKCLKGANLYKANLSETDLHGTDLREAILIEANLSRANLSKADLNKANLSKADLSRAILIETQMAQATLSQCHIYGIAAWKVFLEETTQKDLIITPHDEPAITVDNLEVAQFIYLLLNNQRIRHVIDTITSKVVLILGRFTSKRKAVLDALREELRHRDYLPILFDFDIPKNRDITETVSLLARMSRFVIADLTDARSIPQELSTIVPNLPSVPIQPILLATEREYSMFEHFKRYPWVLQDHIYTSIEDLLLDLKAIIELAEQKAREPGKR